MAVGIEMLYYAWVILDHSRSAIVGPSVTYKFGVDRIYSFGNIAIVLAFWLEIAYTRGYVRCVSQS